MADESGGLEDRHRSVLRHGTQRRESTFATGDPEWQQQIEAVRYELPEDETSQPRLRTAHVRPDDIIALFHLGGEDEVIIAPNTIDWEAVRVEYP